MSNLSLQVLQPSGRVYEYTDGVVRIGRDIDNDIVLADAPQVSRHHAEIRHVEGKWQVVDLHSTNGTYVNRRRVADSSQLSDNDELQFGAHGPRMRVAVPGSPRQLETQASPAQTRTGASRTSELKAPSKSELFPLHMGLEPLKARGYLIPGLLTVLAFGGFLWALDENRFYAVRIIMLYFVVASTFIVYRLCGKAKSVWVFIASAALVFVLVGTVHSSIVLYPIEHFVYPFIAKPDPNDGYAPLSNSFPARFVFHLFAAGIPEEFEKMLPALIGLTIFFRRHRSRRQSSPLEAVWEVSEPLDGILLAVAAAAGFNFLEAAFGYAVKPFSNFAALQKLVTACLENPTINPLCAELLNNPSVLLKAGFTQGFSVFSQVIVRGVGDVFGHQAYAGICGYYVGLAALRPQYKASLLIRGFLSAALLHATWNATAGESAIAGFFLPAISFVMLVAAILQARKISPKRAQNFATTMGQQT